MSTQRDTSNGPRRREAPREAFPLVNRLHTDVLEEKYGPIRVEVLRHDERERTSRLVDTLGISRTFAVTIFAPDGVPPALHQPNERIKAGQPIGKTFREFGYEIRKNVLEVSILELPPWLRRDFHDNATHAKARLSEFLARRDGEAPLVYGTVIEVYHPDFRPCEISAIDRLQEAPSVAGSARAGIPVEEVWERIGTAEVAYDRADTRYLEAIRGLPREVFLIMERVRELLARDD